MGSGSVEEASVMSTADEQASPSLRGSASMMFASSSQLMGEVLEDSMSTK